MGTRLLQVVTFTNIGAAATLALPHQININGAAQTPDFVAADTPGFAISVTATQVTVTNNNPAPASVNVWLELKHSIPRQLGRVPDGLTDPSLTPRPFVAAAGGGGSGPSGFTPGSVLFANALGNIGEDNAAFFWDDTNNFLGIGTNTPDAPLTVVGAVHVFAGDVTTFGGGSVKVGTAGILFTDTIQHSTAPGGGIPINILVPINVESGSAPSFFGTTGNQGAIFLDYVAGNTKSIGFGWSVNALDQGWINRTSFQNGLTQFRDLFIGDGKGNVIATFDATTKSLFIGGPGVADANSLGVTGGLWVHTNAAEYVWFGANKETFWVGGVGATSMGTNFNTNGPATLFVNDVGFNGGITQFRSFQVNDGKGGTIMLLDGATKLATFGDSIDMATSLLRGGTKVVGAQGAAVADATGASLADTTAQLNLLLARLRASTGHGLIAG